MIVVVAEVRVKPDAVDDFRDALSAVIDPSRAENGAISYRVFRDLDDPALVLFVEEWQDSEALDKHFATSHFQLFEQQLADCITEPNKVSIHQVVQTNIAK